MHRFSVIFSLFVLCLTGICNSASASTSLEIDGQVRSRSELDRKDFSSDFAVQTFSDLRTRLGLRAVVNENAVVYVQFQDSRRLGGTSDAGDQSGTLVNTANVDVHQAFLHVRQLWEDGPGLKAGRFEVNLGNQRVFGAVGWHNVGRSWEGITVDYQANGLGFDLFWLKRLEVNDEFENEDFDLFGSQLVLPDWNTQLFTFYEYHADGSAAANNNALDRISSGLYYQRTMDAFDVSTNLVYQFGEQVDPISFNTYDIRAFLVTFEAGFSFDNGRIAAAIDYASGDDDPTDNTFEAYNNLYYTGHKFRGFMDYFISSQPEGLIDLIGRVKLIPAEGWNVGANLHYFRTAAEYVDSNNEATSDVGAELDLYASTSRIRGLNWTSGASIFLPTESFAGPDADPGFWLYTMFTVNFSEHIIK